MWGPLMSLKMFHVWCAYLTPHSPLLIYPSGSLLPPPPAPTRHWQSKKGKTALSEAKNDEIRALLKAAASLKMPETYYGSFRVEDTKTRIGEGQ